eukprot:1959638-Pyramimonas_sp.AAC.2
MIGNVIFARGFDGISVLMVTGSYMFDFGLEGQAKVDLTLRCRCTCLRRFPSIRPVAFGELSLK